MTLLAAQGTDILGTQEKGDYFWRFDEDDTFFHRTGFKRMLRSISSIFPGTDHDSASSSSIVNDVMDVLAMTQPQHMTFAPSADQLEPAARKLLGEGSTAQMGYHCRATRQDLSILLSIPLRMRLYKAKWGLGFHLGSFDKADPENEELASILTSNTNLTIDDDDKCSVLDMLVSMALTPTSGAHLTISAKPTTTIPPTLGCFVPATSNRSSRGNRDSNRRNPFSDS